MFFGDVSSMPDEISKTVYLTEPYFTNKFRIVVIDAAIEMSVKIDVLGQTAEDRYSSNPNMEPNEFTESKSKV